MTRPMLETWARLPPLLDSFTTFLDSCRQAMPYAYRMPFADYDTNERIIYIAWDATFRALCA